MSGTSQVITELVVDASGAKSGTDEFTAQMNRAGAAVEGVTAKQGDLAQATADTGQKIEASARSVAAAERAYQTMMARLDPAFAATVSLGKETDTLGRAVEGLNRQLLTGGVTTAQHSQQLAVLQGRMGDVRATTAALAAGTISAGDAMKVLGSQSATTGRATDDLAAKHGSATVAANHLEGAHAGVTRELIVMGHEVLQGNYTRLGGSMLVLTERVQFLQEALKGIVLAALNPFALAGIAVVGTLTAIAVASENTALRMERLRNELSLVRDDYAALSLQADAAAKHLAATTSLSTADARAGAAIVASAPGFTGTPAQIEAIVKAFADLSTAQQKSTLDTKLMGDALRDPVAFLGQMEPLLKTVDSDLVDHAKLLQSAGDKAGAFAIALKAVQDATVGVVNNKTPLETALHDLSLAFTRTGQDGKAAFDGIGTAVTGAMAKVVSFGAGAVNWLRDLNDWAKKTGGPALYGGLWPGGPPGGTLPAGMVPTTSYGGANPVPVTGTSASNITAAVADFFRNQTAVPMNAAAIAGILTNMGAESGFNPSIWNDAHTSYGLVQYDTSGGRYQKMAAATGQAEPGLQDQLNFILGELSPNGPFWQMGKALQAVPNTPEGAIAASRMFTTDFEIPKNAQQKALTRSVDAPRFFATVNAGTVLPQASLGVGFPEGGPTSGFGTGLTNVAKDYQKLADELSSGTVEARVKILQASIGDLDKALANDPGNQKWLQAKQQLTLELYNAVPALEAVIRPIELDIAAQGRMAAAWGNGAVAAAQQAAQNKALAEAYKIAAPGTEEFAAALALLTGEFDRQAAASERAKLAEAGSVTRDQIALIQLETDTLGMNNDARQALITHMKNEQDVARQFPNVSQGEREARVKDLDQVNAMSQALQQQQNALNTLANMFTQAFDTIGNAITQALVSGQGAAVNWRNVMTAVAQQVLQAFLKLAILNPLLNALFGQNQATLDQVLTAVGSAGGGGGTASGGIGGGSSIIGSLSTGGSVLSGGSSILQALGYQGLGGQVNSLLGGPGTSLFAGTGLSGGGIGSGITSFLNTGIGANAGLQGPTITGAPLAGGTIGGALGGFGAGFAVGSLLGTGEQALLNKTGPGPEIGAGIGAAAGVAGVLLAPETFGTSLLLAGLIGGAAGGLGGGLIGPHPASTFSGAEFSVDPATGNLVLGAHSAQGTGDNAAQVSKDIDTLNNALDKFNISVISTGGLHQVGLNTPGGFQDPSKIGSIAEGVPDFRFSSPDATFNKYLTDRSFGSLDELVNQATEFDNLTKVTIPALTKQNTVTGQLADSLATINTTYQAAIDVATKYGAATDDLSAQQKKALDVANKSATDAATALANQVRYQGLANKATLSGNPLDAQAAAVAQFDDNLQSVRDQMTTQLTAIYGDVFKTTSDYATRMANLEKALGDQRLTIVKQYSDQILAAQRAIDQTDVSLVGRAMTARATLSGNPADALSAATYNFQANADAQVVALQTQLKALYGESYGDTLQYQTELLQLEKTLGIERLAVVKQYTDQIAANDNAAANISDQIAAQAAAALKAIADQNDAFFAQQATQQKQIMDQAAGTAAQTVASLVSYTQTLQTSSASPLPPLDQYALAHRQFNAVSGAAASGDYNSYSQLQTYANSFLGASRTVNGSGVAYANDFQAVLDALNKAATVSPDTLTASVLQIETRNQTATLNDTLNMLLAAVNAVTQQLKQNSAAPARVQAA